MKLSTIGGDAISWEGGLLVLGRYEDAEPSAAEIAVNAALDGALFAAIERERFKGKARQKVQIDTLGRVGAARVLVMGLGDADDTDPAVIRDHGAIAANAALAGRFTSVAFVVPAEGTAGDLVTGAHLGAYRYTDLISDDPESPRAVLEGLTLISDDDVSVPAAHGEILAAAVTAARDLVNAPAHVCTPTHFAEFAQAIAEDDCFELTVLDRAQMKVKGMGGILGVAQAAKEEPRFIHLKYTPASGDDSNAIALVGKGITFDSGGLSLKPPKSMIEMYMDMGGAAAVLGAMKAVAALKPGVAVHGIVGACENMVGADSYRPSDILTMYSGKTVEVLNTDAEGRLVLADCIHYATELKPRCIVDLATLTGAVVVGLGPNYAGLFTDDDALADEIEDAAAVSGEKLWRLPLDPKLAKTLESKRADMTNLGIRWGGAISAAHFLKNFKGDHSWAHIDIAGPAMAEKDDGQVQVGGTGFAVLTLITMIEAAAAR